MNPAGNIPVDLLVLAMVAGFLVLRLRSILGRRTGFEGAPPVAIPRAANAAPVIDGRAEPVPVGPGRKLPDPLNPAGRAMAAMQSHRPQVRPRPVPGRRRSRFQTDCDRICRRRPRPAAAPADRVGVRQFRHGYQRA